LSDAPDQVTPSHSSEHVVSTHHSSLSKQVKNVWQGDNGSIPILIGLAALVIYFQVENSVFLTPQNLTNLLIQACFFVLLSMAEIWLLLLGEIDLSLGFVAGIGAAVAVILVDTKYNWPWWLAVLIALAITTGIATLSGELVIRLRLPSFIVTLAGLLGWQGVLIWLVDKQGTGGAIPLHNNELYYLVNGNFTPFATIIFMIAIVAISSFAMLRADRNRRSSGLDTNTNVTIAKIVLLVIAGGLMIWIFNTNRSTFTTIDGMPFVIPIVLAILAAGSFILIKTKAGRYIYAIGGNSEAARRAGVNVNRYRLMAFSLAGLTAGIAGLIYASRLGGISDSIDAGNLVLESVAAAVIGGTSLFGGRGKMINAVVGGVIIATIPNGMGLIGMSAATQYMATAIVLLAAVSIDSIARRGSTVLG
jgi:D-xylose transport system permease protein